MSEKRVSIIIPCYNGEKFLSEAIQSVLTQTYRLFEIIVVDDGSTDGTADVAECYPFVRYLYQDNQGVAAARNKGLSESRGEYLVFLDQDDRLLPEALEIGVDCLNAYPDCGFVFGRSRPIDAEGRLLPVKPQRKIQAANYRAQMCGQSLVPPAAAMFRHTILDSVGGFNPSFVPADDYDIYLRVSREFPIYCHNQFVVEWRKHGQNQSRDGMQTLDATLRVLDAQWEFIKGNKDYEAAYRLGKRTWRNTLGRYLGYQIAHHLVRGQFGPALQIMLYILLNYPQGFVRCPLEILSNMARRFST